MLALAVLFPAIGNAETAMQELQRMEQVWRSAKLTNYSFRPNGEYNLLGHTAPVVVKSHDGRVASITFESDYGKYRAGQKISLRALRRMTLVPVFTVEEFFDFIRENIDPDQPAGTVAYHDTLGYPLRVKFDDPDMDDDDVFVQIVWFEPEG